MGKAAAAIIALIIIVGGGALLYNHNHKSNTSNNSNSSSNTPPPAQPATTNSTPANNASGSQSNASTSSVTIQNFAFSPSSITVKKGTKVTWTNMDTTAHTVTETDGQAGPSSGDLSNGQTYSFTYNTAGTFHYHCSIHSEMTGTVTVTD